MNRRTKHIPIKYHYVTDLVEDGIIFCAKVDTKENSSDLMTKAVATMVFKTLFPTLMGHARLPTVTVLKMTNMNSEYLLVRCDN